MNNLEKKNAATLMSLPELIETQSVIPRSRQDVLKWNGWGYNDSAFRVNEKDVIEFTGSRYPIGNKELPYFTTWVKDRFQVDLAYRPETSSLPKKYPDPIITDAFLATLNNLNIDYSLKGVDRLIRAHGHSLREIYMLKQGILSRIPDIVIWPSYFQFK